MASQPLQPPVTARLDRAGRLVAADPPLASLQEEAGARLGAALALPQLAAIARLALRLGVTITRPAVAASEAEDIDLWVRAEPDADGVTLVIERWSARLPVRSRWEAPLTPSALDAAAGEQKLATDREMRLLHLAPDLAHRLHLQAEEAIGQPLVRLFRPQEDEGGNLPLVTALAARQPFGNQLALVRGSGQTVLLDGTPRMEEGRFDGYDIRLREPGTERPLAGLPLDDLLKEPLASIIDQAREIAARSEGPLKSDYAGYGADITTAARHLLDLLAQLSPGQGRGEAHDGEALDLAELVLDAAGLVQPQAAERRVVLDIGGLPRLPARGQARSITQILVNLIGNAVRFSPEGGAVSITLGNGSAASVTVSDQGSGVAPQDRLRIFERFEQAGPRPGNAGLGLAISRRLAREMGGDVELLPSAAGAVFRLSLPPA